MKRMLLLTVVCGFMAVPAVADPWTGPLSGSLTSANGLVVGGNWDVGTTTFSWELTQADSSSPWHYKYTFVAPEAATFSPPALSHLILQVSAPDTPGIQDFALSYPDYFESNGYIEKPDEDITWYSGGAGDPGWPANVAMYGIKFQNEGGTTYILEFDSLRNPMVGSFFAKGGSDSYAYNTGLDGGDDFIPVPNASYVPVFGAFLLGMFGLGAAGMKLRRRV